MRRAHKIRKPLVAQSRFDTAEDELSETLNQIFFTVGDTDELMINKVSANIGRNRLAELGKYMSWRVLPRDIRRCLRRYLNFVWDCAENIGEVEDRLLDKLSPTLRSKLSVHMHVYVGEQKKRCNLDFENHVRERLPLPAEKTRARLPLP